MAFCQELLHSEWELDPGSSGIVRTYSSNNNEDLRGSTEVDLDKPVFVQLRTNALGQYESDTQNDATRVLVLKCIVSMSQAMYAVYSTLGRVFLDGLDPADGSQGYRFFHKNGSLEDSGISYIELTRVVLLPTSVEYLNRSAEIHSQLAVGFQLFLRFGGTYLLDGEAIDNPLIWISRFLSKRRTLYPEFVWGRRSEAEVAELLAVAEGGEADAAYTLGTAYRSGDGVPEDLEKSALWFQKAADGGDADAQNFLGASYLNGRGVPHDLEKAVFWIQKAAEQGHVEAAYNFGSMWMSGEGVEQSAKRAGYWWLIAAEAGMVEAQYNLGRMHENGDGVPRSFEEAAHWYLQAAEQGTAEAQVGLALLFANGQGVQKSLDTASSWLKRAAAQGNQDALRLLGEIERSRSAR